jgi:hypothetical protein
MIAFDPIGTGRKVARKGIILDHILFPEGTCQSCVPLGWGPPHAKRHPNGERGSSELYERGERHLVPFAYVPCSTLTTRYVLPTVSSTWY